MADIVRVKLIAHPRDRDLGQRFVVRADSLAGADIEAMSDDEFEDWVIHESEALEDKALAFVDEVTP